MSNYSELFPYVGEFTAHKGTTTHPTLRFEGDLTTGIYSSGAGAINFVSAASDILKVDPTLEGLGGIDVLGAARSPLFYVGDGTVTAPSIAFTNDKDTGLYRISDDKLGIAVNGTNAMMVQYQGDDFLTFRSSVVFDSVTSIRLPSGPTGYRPVAEAQDGDIRYNSTTKQFEGYTDNEWISFGRPKDVKNAKPVEEPDGILTSFTLSSAHQYVTGTLEVFVNGLLEEDISYISSTEFGIPSPAPEAGDVITISYTRRDHY